VADGKLYAVSSGLGAMIGQFAGGGAPPANVTPQAGQNPFGDIDFSIYLYIFDLNTNERIIRIDLTNVAATQGPRIVNDVAIDAQGNAYVTDSIAGAIYRVDAQGNTAYLTDPKFATELGDLMAGGIPGGGQGGAPGQGGPSAEGFSAQLGLNGIVYHPDGYLLVGKSGEGKLFKIPLDNPANVVEVTVPEVLTGVDALRLTADNKLVAVAGQTVFILSSADAFATASIDEKIAVAQGATSAAIKDAAIYVLQSGIGAGQPPQEGQTLEIPAATIVRVK
jgi:hypothetical protein